MDKPGKWTLRFCTLPSPSDASPMHSSGFCQLLDPILAVHLHLTFVTTHSCNLLCRSNTTSSYTFNAALVCTIQIRKLKCFEIIISKPRFFFRLQSFLPLVHNKSLPDPPQKDKQKILQYLPRPLTTLYASASVPKRAVISSNFSWNSLQVCNLHSAILHLSVYVTIYH